MKVIDSADGKHRVEIRSDGRYFRFIEESELWDEGYGEMSGFHYWTPTHLSGLYDSAEAAEADARATLDWLRGEAG